MTSGGSNFHYIENGETSHAGSEVVNGVQECEIRSSHRLVTHPRRKRSLWVRRTKEEGRRNGNEYLGEGKANQAQVGKQEGEKEQRRGEDRGKRGEIIDGEDAK